MNHIMLDIETMSTQPNAAVFEVAMRKFDPATGAVSPTSFLWQFVPTTGDIDPQTVLWWTQQDRRLLEKDCMTTEAQAVADIYQTLEEFQECLLWAKPASFDCVILEQLLMRNRLKMPIRYWQWRDVRTIVALAQPMPNKPTTTHQALQDIDDQIAELLWAWKELGL